MKRSLALAAMCLLLGSPRAVAGGPGEVTGVSIIPRPGRALVVIDVRGSVTVQDFTLSDPNRLVIDVLGARLRVTGAVYDGVNRAGVTNIRYSQFRPDVVRIVLELDDLRSYNLEYVDEEIRISFGTDHAFQTWSSAQRTAPRPESRPVERSAVAVAHNPPPPVFTPPLTQESQQPRITVTWDSASIADVMTGFARFSGKSIILGSEVSAMIQAEINNQPWDVAFQAILEAHGLIATEDVPGIIKVESLARRAAADSTEPLQTRLIPVNFARADALRTSIAPILTSRGNVVADLASNTLIVIDVESRIESVEELVAQLDRPTPQVSIQAKLIFVNRTDIEDLGVQYDLGTRDAFFNRLVQRPDPSTAEPVDTDGDGIPDALVPTETFSPEETIVTLGGNALAAIANAGDALPKAALELIFSTAIGNFDLTTFVSALQEVSLADLQAEPLITTSDNTAASILVGERTPIRTIDVGAQTGTPVATVSFEETGIKLQVTPHVTNTRQILLQIHAENSSIEAAAADIGFTLATQEATSEILVRDGETAVIAGLTVTQITVAKSGIPYLVDLPLIGRLFGFSTRREERRDLLILVTPHIIEDPGY